MKWTPRSLVAWLIGSSIAMGAASAHAADPTNPTVVELFQSQGCSSCPPANANLNALSERPDVLALSFAVTYWDRLGWKDTFAKPQFTERQWQYARAMRQQDVYTPQVVVNGRVAGVGADPGEIESLISRADRGETGPAVTISGGSAELGAVSGPARAADVLLVRYDPRMLEVPVRRGENAGKTLPHKHIVREMFDWAGGTGDPRPSACPRTILPCAPRSSSKRQARARSSPRRGGEGRWICQAKSASPPAKAEAICGDRAAISRTRPIPDPRPQSRKVRTMTSRLKFLIPAAACLALGGVAFASVARAEDAPAKDAMSTDAMSGGPHVGGPYGGHNADEEAPHEKAYDEGRPHDGAGDAEIIRLPTRGAASETWAASTT